MVDRTRQLIAIAVLALVIIAALIYEVVIPQVKVYRQLCATSRAEQAQVANDRIIANSLRTEMAAFDQTKSDLKAAGMLFDTEMRDGSSTVLFGLKAAATEVVITSIKPGLIVEKSNYLELPLDITASGNYLNVVAFYADLERLPNLTDFRIFKIVAAPTANDDSNVTITMSMVIFTAKTPTEKLSLEEISNWVVGRDNVFEPLDGFGQVSAPAQGGGTSQGGGGAQAPGTPSVPPFPQQPLEPFNSGSVKNGNGVVPLQTVNSATSQP